MKPWWTWLALTEQVKALLFCFSKNFNTKIVLRCLPIFSIFTFKWNLNKFDWRLCVLKLLKVKKSPKPEKLLFVVICNQPTNHSPPVKTLSKLSLSHISAAAGLMHTFNAHAATDITGFGILGHAQTLARQQRSEVSFVIHNLPVLAKMAAVSKACGNMFGLMHGTCPETSGVCWHGSVALSFTPESPVSSPMCL